MSSIAETIPVRLIVCGDNSKTSIMADAAAARREARRKRILENSHNRLQLISGKTGEDLLKGSPNRTVISGQDDEIPFPSDNNSNTHSWTCSNNGSIAAVFESLESLSSSYHLDTSAGGEEVTTDSSNLISSPSCVKELQLSLFEKIVVYQYDIVFLSLLIQLFHSIISLAETIYFFLPVVIYSVTKMICFPQESDTRIANALRLMNQFSSSRVQKIIQITQYLGALFNDICIFLFVTICIQSVYITWREGLLT